MVLVTASLLGFCPEGESSDRNKGQPFLGLPSFSPLSVAHGWLCFALKSRAGGSHWVRWALLAAGCQQEKFFVPLAFCISMFGFLLLETLAAEMPCPPAAEQSCTNSATSTRHTLGIAPPLRSEEK